MGYGIEKEILCLCVSGGFNLIDSGIISRLIILPWALVLALL